MDVETSAPLWAAFDAEWYGRKYGAVISAGCTSSSELLEFYHAEGVKLGHSPSPYFDERWYLTSNPDVAQAVADGAFASGFEHYGLVGHKSRSAHWLFSEAYYFSQHADLTASALQRDGFLNGYDHYLSRGDREFRSGHWLFDPAMHRAAALAFDAAGGTNGQFGCFVHGDRELASAARLSWYFDPGWYLEAYPEVAEEIQTGGWSCALEHYLCNPTPVSFNPNSRFSEGYYIDAYPEVKTLLESNRVRNCFEHFLKFGATELRNPSVGVDLGRYYQSASVQKDIEQGHFRDAFAHLEATHGRAPNTSAGSGVDETHARRLYRVSCENMLPGLIRCPLDFRYGQPNLSVILVALNNFALTMATLASLRSNYQGDMQVILVDNGSNDDISVIESYVLGLEIIRFKYNAGFVDGCNAALERVRGPATLFLNNDVQLCPDAIRNALSRLWLRDDTGAVGGKIIRSHGQLQEAGSILWRDGWALGYMRDQDPNAPEANFVRPVDFCSGAFLACKSELLKSLNGFDEAYSPAYFEEADLCIRMRALGYQVIYDPDVSIIHYEYATSKSNVAIRLIERNHPIFRQKNGEFLRRQRFNQPGMVAAARSAVATQRRILFIDDRLPLRHLGSGLARAHDIVTMMAALHYHVTVYPIYRATETISEIYGAFPDTVEVMFDRELPQLEEFLIERSGYFDAIWISRTHNMARLAPILERCGAHIPTGRIVLDIEALGSVRTVERNRVLGLESDASHDITSLTREELAPSFLCQRIVVVNGIEADLVRSTGFEDIHVLGHMQSAELGSAGWSVRRDLLFLASILDEASPNLDSLSWFGSNVLPLLKDELPEDVAFVVAGSVGRRVDLSPLRYSKRVKVIGQVADLKSIYNQARLFIAPSRFSSGMPYRVHEAAAHGVPVVASSRLCHQLGWKPGIEIACGNIEDPEHFANTIIDLYNDERAWNSMQRNALGRIAAENSVLDYREKLAAILQDLFA
jgi:O-antigen biosynthesis protein